MNFTKKDVYMKVTDIRNINNVIRFLKENEKCYPFYRFLKKKGCAAKFFHNLIKDHINWKNYENIDEPMIRYFKSIGCKGFIDFAFAWEYTKEGFLFWECLNKSWLIFIYEKQENY